MTRRTTAHLFYSVNGVVEALLAGTTTSADNAVLTCGPRSGASDA